MQTITTIAELEALYDAPARPSLVKVADRIIAEYRAWIEAAPFCVLATVGPEGVDASPRGDRGTVAHVLDEHLLALPDRRGNNRIDSLRNIVRDPRVSLMFLVPGGATVIRVNGEARICAAPDLLARFETEGKLPRSVILVRVREVYFQCARAILRAGLWDASVPELAALPSPGDMLAAMSKGEIDGADYDAEWPVRAAASMW